MNKLHIFIIILCIALGGLMSCADSSIEKFFKSTVKAPEATIERDVKGHEMIHSIQIILRLARQSGVGEERIYKAYNITQRETPIPLYQEITLSKDEEGNMAVTSERKTFDVIKGKEFYYGLELKYYNINGQLINHQFSSYDPKDLQNSTLHVHQHLFTVQNYSLDKHPLVYPMTLDSVYYDRYLFQYDASGKLIPASATSPSNVYVPENSYLPNTLRYSLGLALRASDQALSSKVDHPYTDPETAKTYRLYKTISAFDLNELVPEIFTYEYRDTDPVEDELWSAIDGYDDLGRIRNAIPVERLRQKRSLDPGSPLDALGFKGILQFHRADITFQMRVCICHILTSTGKYDRSTNLGGLHAFNELSPAWNSFDIDYPVSFRVIADVDGDRETCIKQVERYYPKARRSTIEQMFWGEGYFDQNYTMPYVTM